MFSAIPFEQVPVTVHADQVPQQGLEDFVVVDFAAVVVAISSVVVVSATLPVVVAASVVVSDPGS